MHRRVRIGLLPFLCVAGLSASVAQPSRILTEAEFLSALDESHPAVVASAEDLALARARVIEASIFENPVLGVVREDPSGPVEQTDWMFSWQLPHADRRPLIQAREKEVEGARARLSQRLLELRLALRGVYAEWAVAAAREERLAAQARRVQALAEREAARAERGESSGLEAHRLELAAAELDARVALAAVTRQQAWGKAAGWFPALPPEARPVLPILPSTPPPPPSPEPPSQHPLVAAAEADLAAARLEREVARRFLLSPEVTVGWQRQEAGLEVGSEAGSEVGSESMGGVLLGLAWSVPLFDRGQAEKAASEARISGAQARLARVEREVNASRTAAWATFERLSRALDAAAASLAVGERMLDGAEAAFRHGEANLTDLLDTHRSVTESALTLLDLQAAALAAHRELERLSIANSQETRP